MFDKERQTVCGLRFYLLRGLLMRMMRIRIMLAMTPMPPRLVRITAEILSD